MTLDKNIQIGFFTVFLMTFMDVFGRYAVVSLNATPAVYTSVALFSAGITLLIVAGPGKLGLDAFKSLHTWLYAILQISFAICEVYTYSLSTTTEGNILYRSVIVVSIIFSWMLFGRKPYKTDIIGSVLILIATGYVAWTLPVEVRTLTIVSLVIGVILFDLRTKVAEIHSISNQTSSVRDQCRVVGIVLLVTSFLFMAAYALVGFISDTMGYSTIIPSLPTLQDFKNTPALLGAVGAGVFIIAAAKFLLFYTTKVIKTENYMLLTSLIIPLTILAEYAADYFGFMPLASIGLDDIIAGLFVTAVSVWMGVKRHKKQVDNSPAVQ